VSELAVTTRILLGLMAALLFSHIALWMRLGEISGQLAGITSVG
jgi:hypothetical protein